MNGTCDFEANGVLEIDANQIAAIIRNCGSPPERAGETAERIVEYLIEALWKSQAALQ
jgi:hypothetical protein